MFAFFASASNLERLTPSWLHFKILNQSTAQIEKGTLIDYSLRLHGVSFRWRTLIDDWVPKSYFIDTQLKGPYKLWHHSHFFKPCLGGVLVIDRIRYQVPLGFLGDCLAGAYVKKDISKIFDYRREVISSIFGSWDS